MSGPAMLPGAVQDHGVPFDVFIQALTLQLDKAQAAMAMKARVARLPLTFAVKDVSLDLRAFVRMIDDEMWVRPSGPGDTEASTIKLALTTVTKPMIDENAIGFQADDPKFSLREALGDHISEEDRHRLEMIGVQTVQQLQDLRSAAGADVVARLARMPVNRLQQAMMAAGAPRVTAVASAPVAVPVAIGPVAAPTAHVTLQTPAMRLGRLPLVHIQGEAIPVLHHDGEHLVVGPRVSQLGLDAVIDYGDGDAATVRLTAGSMGRWHDKPAAAATASSTAADAP
jgi:hypothetical protein